MNNTNLNQEKLILMLILECIFSVQRTIPKPKTVEQKKKWKHQKEVEMLLIFIFVS